MSREAFGNESNGSPSAEQLLTSDNAQGPVKIKYWVLPESAPTIGIVGDNLGALAARLKLSHNGRS